jgi:hypothetical protein
MIKVNPYASPEVGGVANVNVVEPEVDSVNTEPFATSMFGEVPESVTLVSLREVVCNRALTTTPEEALSAMLGKTSLTLLEVWYRLAPPSATESVDMLEMPAEKSESNLVLV